MKTSASQAPWEDLSNLRNWAKRAVSEFFQDEEFSKAKMSLEILEFSKQIEQRLENLVGSRGDAPAYAPERIETERTPEGENEEAQGYPVFFVKGDSLVKQGRTRDKRDIYEQKLAKVEFDRIVGALRDISQSKKEFDIRDVLALISVPNYRSIYSWEYFRL